MKIEHRGFEAFRKGTFGNAGANLFVDATGAVRRIIENDLNGDGLTDAAWSSAITESDSALKVPDNAKYMQYQVEFISPALCNTPRLYAVTIE